MTDEQIDAMEAGREMDALVAEKVMGWIWRACPDTFKPGRPWRRWLSEPDRNLPKWDGVTEMPVDGLLDEESDVPEYSTDIAAAWQVVEKLQSQTLGGDIHLEHLDGEWSVSTCHDKVSSSWADWASAGTPALAICRAALKCCRNVTTQKGGLT